MGQARTIRRGGFRSSAAQAVRWLARHRPAVGLLVFLAGWAIGFPVLYSAALGALPLVMLPEPPSGHGK